VLQPNYPGNLRKNMTELILGPIIGGLSDISANLWGRTNKAGILRAWLGKKDDLSDAHLAGISTPLQAQDGYAGVAPVAGLEPETTYYFDLRLDDRNPPVQKGYPKFTTFPVPGKPSNFSFVFGSCFRPEEKEYGGRIFTSLENQRSNLDQTPAEKLRFGLFIGDQIYSDDWKFNSLGKGAATLEEYRAVYEYTWSRPPFRNLLKNLPAFMTLDDHEVDDDWRWTDQDRTKATFSIWARFTRFLNNRPQSERMLNIERVRNALKAYWEHQGMHAPPIIIPPAFDAESKYILQRYHPGSLAYSFTYGAAAFFVLDTRTMRVRNRHEQHMLGDGQWQMLKQWLLSVREKYPVKFLVSSSSVLDSMLGDFLGDRWSGFRIERDRLLRFIGDNHIENLYILAGDLHCSHCMTAECGPRFAPVTIHEFCSSPFEQVCNKHARLLYTSIKTGSVHNPKRQFVITRPNFGVVQVLFQGGRSRVNFNLYGTDGNLLAST
jgi:phosphodiesterase/alkaline phosphatase D-like protein